jgi:protoheme IX farnesyltransferase
VTGQVDPHALLLFLIIFAWTPPHFWALAIYRREEYAQAQIPMLPITHGVEYTRTQILLYTIVLTVASVLPYVTYMSGAIYLTGALLLDAGFLYYAIRMQRDHADLLALRTFRYSIVYLTALFACFFLDHFWPALARLLGVA